MAPSDGYRNGVSSLQGTRSSGPVPIVQPAISGPRSAADGDSERVSPQPPTPPTVARPPEVSIKIDRSSRAAVRPPDLSTAGATAQVAVAGGSLSVEDVEEPSDGAFDAAARVAPPWLISTVAHMVMIVLLGLWIFAPEPSKVVDLVAEAIVADDLGEQLEEDEVLMELENAEVLEQKISLSDLPEVEDPFAAPPEFDVQPLVVAGLTSEVNAPSIGMALSGRSEGMKEALVSAYGGTQQTENAVRLGLAWLADQQLGNGSWSLRGPYGDGSHIENNAAATAMAMLAFLGNGHTHQHGKYKKNVAKGLKFLLMTEDDGFLAHGATHNHRLYTQAQGTIALCELYAMTNDYTVKAAAERAVAYCVAAQDPNRGGWRYSPGDDSDTSVTGWFVMALQSAKMAGLDVPTATFNKVTHYLDRAGSEQGARYGYTIGASASITMTAEGLLCRQYLGWERDDERLARGVEALLQPENLPTWQNRNVYYWYYATQVLHHTGGPEWDAWNDIVKTLLPKEQVEQEPERGSWNPTAPTPDRWGHQGGRLFVTCLSIYILEVYYRHLPIYSDINR